MARRQTLTRKQAQVLKSINAFIAKRGYPPSMRELAAVMGLTPGTIHFHIHSLVRRGYLQHDGSDHGIQVLANDADPAGVPLLGSLIAGLPLELRVESDEVVHTSAVTQERVTHALRVRGDEFREDGILDGDILLIHRQDTARQGEVAVVLLPDGSATVRRVYAEANRWRLVSLAASSSVTHAGRVQIHGTVIALHRELS